MERLYAEEINLGACSEVCVRSSIEHTPAYLYKCTMPKIVLDRAVYDRCSEILGLYRIECLEKFLSVGCKVFDYAVVSYSLFHIVPRFGN